MKTIKQCSERIKTMLRENQNNAQRESKQCSERIKTMFRENQNNAQKESKQYQRIS